MAILKNTTINDTGYLKIPSGTTTQRPSVPTRGMFRYNTNLNTEEYYNGSQWVSTRSPILVTNSMIKAVVTTGMTTTVNQDVNGSYVYQGTINLGGCGSPNSAVFICLRDVIPWTRITCFFEMNGTGACWSFMGGSGFTEVTPATTNLVPGGNIEEFNQSLGDRIYYDNGTFVSNPAYAVKWSACDNSADNFFRFNDYKSFWTTGRRKDISNGLAGIFHSRSCNTTGAYIKVSNIYIS